MNLKTVLHVGCGPRQSGILHPSFGKSDWKEIRLDINPDVEPDIVASITHMDSVENSKMDAIYSSHNLEHLYPHEVDLCLKEFLRVLKSDGFALIAVPNLKHVAKLIAEDKLEVPAYQSPAGPIFPLDMVYGFRPAIAAGNTYMAHKTGFTPKSLGQALIDAGFAWAKWAEDINFGLWIKGYKTPPPKEIADQPLW
ncbi:MAG: methyltransferase domain-containing protein [Desulfobacter sp.]|nr:MAG: methyltransferase domain-containing protein [Desulfobacter sp.]